MTRFIPLGSLAATLLVLCVGVLPATSPPSRSMADPVTDTISELSHRTNGLPPCC